MSGTLAAVGLALTFVLTLHSLVILGPQVFRLRRKMAQPKYADTMYLAKLRCCYALLHRRLVQLRITILITGAISLVLACL